ncbi:MAG: Maf family protein [Bacilli bacterium]|nr:Maf family protein [Bacilli bacterium]
MGYVLASSSPRRKELMKKISSVFVIDVSNVDETVDPSLSPKEAVKEISLRKGQAVLNRHKDDIVISADTIVVIDGQIIGKPHDEKDAKRILNLLSGRKHYVYTSYCIFYKGQVYQNTVGSSVYFNVLSQKLIDDYVATKSPLDKAGAYGVQDNEMYPIVSHIEGSLSNVIGFPVEDIIEDLKKLELL